MRRGAKPAKAKVKAKRPAGTRDLGMRLAESLEQQAATAEILRVIGTSPMDTQPVFDVIARSGVRVCGAHSCTLFVVDGDMVRVAATHGVPVERVERFRTQFPMPLSAEEPITHMLHERRVFHLANIEHNPAATPQDIENARLGRYRTRLMVPMLRGDSALGLIAVTHQAPTPFSDQQIALLQTFADQAVIAIENVRLFNETKEALEQQTATAEILRVISSSPTDVQPVFDVIVERAVHLCGARFGRVYRIDGGVIHMVAGYGLSAVGLGEVQRTFPRPASDDTIAGRVILTRQPVFIRDIEREEGVPALSRGMIKALETRSQVTIPMLRAGEPIGAMTLGWAEPEAFDEQQIALLQTFADQA